MAEARSAAALSFQVTHDGVSVSYDQELLRDIWHAFQRGYKRRVGRFKNNFIAGLFPANTLTFSLVVAAISVFSVLRKDLSFGIVPFIQHHILSFIFGEGIIGQSLSVLISGALIWFVLVQVLRFSIKFLLTYKGWMYEQPGKSVSTPTKLWLGLLHLISKSEPMLHSFQGALPHLPLPSLDETVSRHLRSMKPILSEQEYAELEFLSERFRKGVGRRLQRYLVLKSWLSTNYVTDWWEEFVYMRQRSPIMINSNYYGFDTLNEHPTTNQAARAANITWAAIQFRRLVDRQEVTPFSISPKSKVPFCTMQYERLFNSCRIPGEEVDRFLHWDDAKHVAVLCNGCWFKVIVHNGIRLLGAAELQYQFDEIVNHKPDPAEGEDRLAALTAGDRQPWSSTRRAFFRSGINKTSLNDIERAAFVVILDGEEVHYDPNDPSKLDHWAHNLLHGKAYDRWFDKSFNLIISKNGHVGCNTEHSWGDAAVTAHFMEWCLLRDIVFIGYDEKGNTKGDMEVKIKPERLKWSIPEPALEQIEKSLTVANDLIADVEMALLVWTDYGKGFAKKLGVSPDAFLQMCLQYTYYKNQNKFSLTYEASMTRLYREGRTETVRSCTVESSEFVLAMQDKNKTREERLAHLKTACNRHQELYRDAMCGKGVDRHLFALYVIKRYLEEESPFFDKIFPPSYLLSTSQTPLNQCETDMEGMSSDAKLRLVSAGGGFGPVADRGYGVSYIVAGENQLSFHISSKRSADNTSSQEFREELKRTLEEMKNLMFLSRVFCSSFVRVHDTAILSVALKEALSRSCIVQPDFISQEEEAAIFKEVEPHMKRLRYEKSHWDDAIHLYREREQKKWSPLAEQVIQRIRKHSFPQTADHLTHVHILDLHEDGVIKPHIDSVRYCGNVITGISLLSDCVMRLRHKDDPDKLIIDLFLQRRSLYRLGEQYRYDFTHEVLANKDSVFENKPVKKGRRISIICRDRPMIEDNIEESLRLKPIPLEET
ncbi:unnamed protein product [Auanema sp. JU1783]|nr:unnamed protein product [Auanema sp. JU1783]